MSEDIRAKYFLPPDDYEILRFGGESVKDEEKGIERMMRYYQGYLRKGKDEKTFIIENYNSSYELPEVQVIYEE